MRRLLLSCAALYVSAAVAAGQECSPKEEVQRIIDESPALQGCVVGISVKTTDGIELLDLSSRERLVPASNTKLVTTGCALKALGGDYRFKTTLAHSGTIRDGVLKGDLYIIGQGDPTISEETFPQWERILSHAGITEIEGDIVGDGSFWEGQLEDGSWDLSDTGTFYGTGGNALCFYKNAIDFLVRPGAEGREAIIIQAYPNTPWLQIRNLSVTGPAGSTNSIFLYTTDFSNEAVFRGNYPVDKPAKTEHFANKHGALTCASEFCNYLKISGVSVGGKARSIEMATPQDALQTIGRTESQMLQDIVARTNYESDNFFAESIFRAMGKELTGSALWDSCRVARSRVLEALLSGSVKDEPAAAAQEPWSGLRDGSGLSRMNIMSASFLTDFLNAMAFDKAFVASLPSPGEGTIAPLLKGSDCRSRLRLKSGSMTGVLCYSGYILGEDGIPAASVSLLVNGATSRQANLRSALEPILEAIYTIIVNFAVYDTD